MQSRHSDMVTLRDYMEGGSKDPITVSALAKIVSGILDSDDRLRGISVIGEVSNWGVRKNKFEGMNAYFDIKDKDAKIRCVYFGYKGKSDDFKDGNTVVVTGDVQAYIKNSVYQLRVRKIALKTDRGELYRQYLELKEKLAAQGLFDMRLKKQLPKFPRTIGIVTSQSADALQDIRNTIRRRYPFVRLILSPTKVQGQGVGREIRSAIQALNDFSEKDENGGVDIIIVARGGGSFEDLYCFNEEEAVRGVFESRIPIVTGIGHETDRSLCDEAADVVAETPTGAAEKSVPNIDDLRAQIEEYYNHARIATERHIRLRAETIDKMTKTDRDRALRNMLDTRTQNVDEISLSLYNGVRDLMGTKINSLDNYERLISSLNPSSIMKKGYSALVKDGKLVRSVGDLKRGDEVSIKMWDGSASASIEDIDKGDVDG